MNPFQDNYFNIALREYQQYINAPKAENTKKQHIINDLENNIEKQKQKTANLKNKCLCNSQFERAKSAVRYTKLKHRQHDILQMVFQFATAGSEEPNLEWEAFLSDALRKGRLKIRSSNNFK